MEEARLTESQLTRLTESEGAPVLDRVVREGFPEMLELRHKLIEAPGHTDGRWEGAFRQVRRCEPFAH